MISVLAENSWNRWNRSTWDPFFEKITKANFLGFQNHKNIKVAYRNDTQPQKISDRSLNHSGVQRFLKFFTKGDFHEFFRNPTQIFPWDPTEVPTKFGHIWPKIGETTGSCSMWFQIEQPILVLMECIVHYSKEKTWIFENLKSHSFDILQR